MRERTQAAGGPIGLCGACIHARRVDTSRGTSYSLCGLHASDPSYPKYPRLPVIACRGFDPGGRGDRPRD